MEAGRRCARCGSELPTHVPEGLCPKCLLRLGLEEDSEQESAGGALPTDSDEPSSPVLEVPGRYRPLGEHSRGGMGRILLVRDVAIGRDIALKELLPCSSQPEGVPPTPVRGSLAVVSRFLKEARITGQLEHPGIVPVYELGQRLDGTVYYTMKLVRGKTLREAIRAAGALSGRLALLSHFLDLCQAIAYAHSRGVIHRDIKPSNVMVGEFGETVVLDWGLAKARGQEDPLKQEMTEGLRFLQAGDLESLGKTTYGKAFGTPAYMSPEQARGEIEKVDERSDIYSLGAVLYEILTGGAPFGGSNPAEIVNKVPTTSPPAIPSVEPNAPSELIAICSRAMAREPEQRYATARDLAEEIQRFQSGLLVRAYEYRMSELFNRFVRKHRAILAASAVATLVLIAVGLFSYLRIVQERNQAVLERNRAEEQRQAAETAQVEAEAQRNNADSERRVAEVARESSEQNAYFLKIAMADAKLREKDYLGARLLLDSCPAQFRNWEWGRLSYLCPMKRRLDAREVQFVPNYAPSLDSSTEWRPDARKVQSMSDPEHILVVRSDNTMAILDAASGKTLLIFEPGVPEIYEVFVSEDGKRVLGLGARDNATLWDAESGKSLNMFAIGDAVRTLSQVRVRALSRDGGSAVVTGGDYGLAAVIINTATGQQTSRSPNLASVFRTKDPEDMELEQVVDLSEDTSRAYLVVKGDAENIRAKILVEWDILSSTIKVIAENSNVVCVGNGVCVTQEGLDNSVLSFGEAYPKQFVYSGGKELKHGIRNPEAGTITVFDAYTGKVIARIEHPCGEVQGFAVDEKRSVHMLLAQSVLEELPGGGDAIWFKDVRAWHQSMPERFIPLMGCDRAQFMCLAGSGARALVIGTDNEAAIWSVETGERQVAIPGEWCEPFLKVIKGTYASSPKDRYLIAQAAGINMPVHLFTVEDGAEQLLLPTGRWSFSNDDRFLFYWEDSGPGGCSVFNLEVVSPPVFRNIMATAACPSGVYVLGEIEGRAMLWDGNRIHPTREIEGLRNQDVLDMAVSADGGRLVTISRPSTITLWDTGKGTAIHQATGSAKVERHYPGSLRSAAAKFTSDGSEVLVFLEGTTYIWDAVTGQERTTLTTGGEFLAFAPAGQYVLATGNEKGATLWDLRSKVPVRRFTADFASWKFSDPEFSSDATHLLFALEGWAEAWNLETGQSTQVEKIVDPLATGGVAAVFSPDDNAVLVQEHVPGDFDSAPVRGPSILAEVDGNRQFKLSDLLYPCSFSPDSSRIACAHYSGNILVYDAKNGAQICTIAAHYGHIRGLFFLPDGKRIVTRGDGGVYRLWESGTGREALAFQISEPVRIREGFQDTYPIDNAPLFQAFVPAEPWE